MELNELFVDSWHENPSALRGRRVVIMGLGIQGGGLGVATYLRDLGVDLVVTDLRSEADLRRNPSSWKSRISLKKLFAS